MTFGNDFKKTSSEKLAGAEVPHAPGVGRGRGREAEVHRGVCERQRIQTVLGVQTSPTHTCNVSTA